MDSYKIFPKKRLFMHLRATTILIIINAIVFLFLSFFPSMINYFALNPAGILQGKYLWTLVSSMFSHVAFIHLAFNMISLFFVGVLVEKIVGPRRFLSFYLISGLFASAVFVLLAGFLGTFALGEKLFGNPSIFGVGASGAIFGLIGMLAVLIPKKKIYLIAGPLIAIILQVLLETIAPNMPLADVIYFILTIYIFLSVFLMFSFNSKIRKFILPIQMPFWILPIVAIVPLVMVSLFFPLPIGNSAHFGGLIIGLIYGFYLRHKFPRKTEMISRFFSR